MNKCPNINFNFLNCCTEYSTQGTFSCELDKRVCFGNFLKQAEKYETIYNQNYIIKLYKSYKLNERIISNNVCFLDKKEIVDYLDSLTKIYPFEYSIKTDTSGKKFDLKLHIVGNLLYHKFLLVCIRKLYEYPYSFILRDVITLKKEKPFKEFSILNLYLLFNSTSHGFVYTSSEDGLTYQHQFYRFFTDKQLREVLDAAVRDNYYILNTLFEPSCLYYIRETTCVKDGEYVGQYNKKCHTCDSEFITVASYFKKKETTPHAIGKIDRWDDSLDFRKKLYIHNLKVLKDNNNI